MMLAQVSPGFQSLPPLPTSKLGPSGADSQMGGFLYILGSCGSLQGTLLWVSPVPQTPQILRLYFPTLEPWVAGSVLFPSCSSWFIRICMWDQLVLQSPPCCASCPSWLPVSAPLTSLNECFFFNSLAVRLPYSSIFWQFWLFFVFKFVVILLWVVWGGKMYLPMPPSWPEVKTS